MFHTKMLRFFVTQTSFNQFTFFGSHTKPHGVIGLIKNYHMQYARYSV